MSEPLYLVHKGITRKCEEEESEHRMVVNCVVFVKHEEYILLFYGFGSIFS